MTGSKRRLYLGIKVSKKANNAKLGIFDGVCPKKNQVWKMQRLAKSMLSMRFVDEFSSLFEKLDKRKDWNKSQRKVTSLLDLFPSLKYSYSSPLPKACRKGLVDIRSSVFNGKTYIGDMARSHSIRLDPVDSPKELKKYRLRIQRVIDWSYKNGLVPVMMTLTIFHRWDELSALCRALRLAWSSLFGSGRAGYERKLHIGLQGFIRRMEETLGDGSEVGIDENNGTCSLGYVTEQVEADFMGGRSPARRRCDLSKKTQSDAIYLPNAGWHPHYHVILFIPRDKLQVLSDYEKTLKEVWLNLVCKFYKQEVGKEIPLTYYEAFKKHGLVLSRYNSEDHAKRCGNIHGKAGNLLEVHDGKYLAKVLGVDSQEIFGGDYEMTSSNAKSNFNGNISKSKVRIGGKVPFDLLREKVTAANVDLWCEYAIATKGIPCFTFSKGLEKTVDEYYKTHPDDKDQTSSFSKDSNFVRVGSLLLDEYKKIYHCFQIGNMLEVSKLGVDKLSEWMKQNFGINLMKPINEDDEDEKLVSKSIPLETPKDHVADEIQVNAEDLAVAEKMENDVYATYHTHLPQIVSKGLSLKDAINSLAIDEPQKETLLSIANYYRKSIQKSKSRLKNLNSDMGG